MLVTCMAIVILARISFGSYRSYRTWTRYKFPTEEAELVTLPKEAVVQCEEQVGERVAVETETVLQNTRVERHYSDASTNTDVREKGLGAMNICYIN